MIFTKVVRNFLEMVNWYKSKKPVVEKPDIKTSENDTTKDEITQQQDLENLDTNNNNEQFIDDIDNYLKRFKQTC